EPAARRSRARESGGLRPSDPARGRKLRRRPARGAAQRRRLLAGAARQPRGAGLPSGVFRRHPPPPELAPKASRPPPLSRRRPLHACLLPKQGRADLKMVIFPLQRGDNTTLFADDDPADRAFRAEVRDWIAANLPNELCNRSSRIDPPELKPWHRKLYQRGWI